ncbi:hypothetical protein HD553DRAFT_348733 [Filobasidium floriforme]|uniref:uncharacterized protein n=1 Tax=Filobasidium floriforme TaxID=5210 RepID=UPI001E8CA491|nr:uncharacterized protein HD553DRAFT_348733 [Filobasidium floriforme]KAH8088219.1 hypothetical protein HD553DRAFT_348733 [Filobasidium floriforme]
MFEGMCWIPGKLYRLSRPMPQARLDHLEHRFVRCRARSTQVEFDSRSTFLLEMDSAPSNVEASESVLDRSVQAEDDRVVYLVCHVVSLSILAATLSCAFPGHRIE